MYKLFHFGLFFLLLVAACKKNKKPFGLEVGKYEITQFKTYPDGMKDTLKWIGYGPVSASKENFSFILAVDSSSNTGQLQFSSDNNNLEIVFSNGSKNYVVTSTDKTATSLRMEYSYIQLLGYVSDSASGQIICNRISL